MLEGVRSVKYHQLSLNHAAFLSGRGIQIVIFPFLSTLALHPLFVPQGYFAV